MNAYQAARRLASMLNWQDRAADERERALAESFVFARWQGILDAFAPSQWGAITAAAERMAPTTHLDTSIPRKRWLRYG